MACLLAIHSIVPTQSCASSTTPRTLPTPAFLKSRESRFIGKGKEMFFQKVSWKVLWVRAGPSMKWFILCSRLQKEQQGTLPLESATVSLQPAASETVSVCILLS